MSAQETIHHHKAAFGRIARERRLARGLSLGALSATTGMPVEYIAGIELGDGNPRFDKLNALAQALDCRLSVLFTEADRAIDRQEAP
jgi:transcriptional regulator with XRE-family HTH domain